ncbi:NAD-dependent epimerase/dehydratase family protein [Nocardioides sp. Kera G14]|uniref:NAD-dependent epimerase/dehydratase family protein n=1 Tax=Nocardioides sp. Kera G14 TaxID=2884264 RepID=UPI001D118C1E|nr:NAD-dependent epimerase/dehydratase family protein [Nocardioides sp. Kera G14]UDY23104.1 GDP-mannose 4,6-dehydratase [Nocardioides sp. Kera G14]
MRVAVTGASGFVGRHLTHELVGAGHEVLGVGREPEGPEGASGYVRADLIEGWPAAEVGHVDAVVHLAALAAVGPSFDAPQRYLEANSAPVTSLCEALLVGGRPVRLLNVSTGAVYAPGTGIAESAPTVASSPYVVSKLLTELQASYYRRRGLDVVTVRPFNHIGPGQGVGFLLPDLVGSVTAARKSGGAVTVGNLDTRRDYTDVRDVVRAYRLLLEAPSVDAEIVNVCSGAAVSGRSILESVLLAMPGSDVSVEVDQARVRPNDPAEISGDSSLLHSLTGWAPRISLEETVRDFVAALG